MALSVYWTTTSTTQHIILSLRTNRMWTCSVLSIQLAVTKLKCRNHCHSQSLSKSVSDSHKDCPYLCITYCHFHFLDTIPVSVNVARYHNQSQSTHCHKLCQTLSLSESCTVAVSVPESLSLSLTVTVTVRVYHRLRQILSKAVSVSELRAASVSVTNC